MARELPLLEREEPERPLELPLDFEPPFAPARLRFADVLAALAAVRAVFALERADFAPDFAVERADFAPDFAVERADFAVDFAVDFARVDALRDEPPLLRELLDEERRDEDDFLRRLPPLRSAAGISSRPTAFASRGICRSRNFAIRSSSLRIERASLCVSLSPTISASVSIA